MTQDRSAAAGNVEILHTAVEAFQRREIGYRDILEDLPAAIYTTDADGRITYFNRACVEFSGRAPVLGDDQWCVAWKLFATDETPMPHDKSPMAVALEQRRAIRGAEAVAERPDGTRINFAAFPTPIFDADDICIGAVNMLIDISAQKQSHERLTLLAREVDHRSRNLLSLVQSMIRLTKAKSVEEFRSEMEGRIVSLSKANSLIAEGRWMDIDLATLISQEMESVPQELIVIDGPHIPLSPAGAQSVAMIVHELCTNAYKYGALSVLSGRVSVTWSVDDERNFMLIWEETGGPPAPEPASKSTGNVIINGATRQLKAKFFRDWRPRGLRCTLLCEVASLSNCADIPIVSTNWTTDPSRN